MAKILSEEELKEKEYNERLLRLNNAEEDEAEKYVPKYDPHNDGSFNINMANSATYDRTEKLDSIAGEKGYDITKEGVVGSISRTVENAAREAADENEAYAALHEQNSKISQAMSLISSTTHNAATTRDYSNLYNQVSENKSLLTQLGMGTSARDSFDEYKRFMSPNQDSIQIAKIDKNSGTYVIDSITKTKFESNPSYYKDYKVVSPVISGNNSNDTAKQAPTIGKVSDLGLHYNVSDKFSVGDMFSKTYEQRSAAADKEGKNASLLTATTFSNKDAKDRLCALGNEANSYLTGLNIAGYDKLSNNPAKREKELAEYIKTLEKNPRKNRDVIDAAKMEMAGLKAGRDRLSSQSFLGSVGQKSMTALNLASGGRSEAVNGLKFTATATSGVKKIVRGSVNLHRNHLRSGGGIVTKAVHKGAKALDKNRVTKRVTGGTLADKYAEKFIDSRVKKATRLDKIDAYKKDKYLGKEKIKDLKLGDKQEKYRKRNAALEKRRNRLENKGSKTRLAIVEKRQSRLESKSKSLESKISRNNKRIQRKERYRAALRNSRIGRAFGKVGNVLKLPTVFVGFVNGIVDAIKRKLKFFFITLPIAAVAGLMGALAFVLLFLLLIANFLDSIPDTICGTQDINYNQYIVDKTCWVLGNGYTKVAARDAYWHYVLEGDYRNYSLDRREGHERYFQYYWFNQLEVADKKNESPFYEIYAREEADNTTQGTTDKFKYKRTDDGEEFTDPSEAGVLDGNLKYIDTYQKKTMYGTNTVVRNVDNIHSAINGSRETLDSINVNMVPILSMAHYRFSGEINYNNYLTVLGYSYTMWVRSHDISKYDSNANETCYKNGHKGYRLEIIDPCTKIYQSGTTPYTWNKSKTYDQITRPSKANCSNIYIHGYNAALGTTMGTIKAAVDDFCEDVAGVCREFWGWLTKETPSSTLPMGCELVIFDGNDIIFSGVTDGYANGITNIDDLSDDDRMSDEDYKDSNIDQMNENMQKTLYSDQDSKDNPVKDESKWNEIKKYFKLKTSPLHVYGSIDDGATVYNTGSAFLVYETDESNRIIKDSSGTPKTINGCDNIYYAQFSSKEDTVVKNQHFAWPLGDDKKIEGKGKAGTWCATTCGKHQHKHGPNCCSKPTMQAIQDPYSGHISTVPTGHTHDDGTCNTDDCPYGGEEHEHSPWNSEKDPGCWTTVAICGGHCGGHAIGKMDIVVTNSWEGLMMLDDLKVPQMMIAADFNGWIDCSQMAWTLKSWKTYWMNKTDSWYSKSRNFSPGRIIAWGFERVPGILDQAVEGLKKTVISIVNGDFWKKCKEFFEGGAIKKMIGVANDTRNGDMEDGDDLWEFTSWYDETGQYIRPELAEGIIMNYGNDKYGSLTDDLQQAPGYSGYDPDKPEQSGNWEAAIDEWSGSLLWQGYFPFTTNYPYPEGNHSVFFYQTDDGVIKYKTDKDSDDTNPNKMTLKDEIVDTPPEGITRQSSADGTRSENYDQGAGANGDYKY